MFSHFALVAAIASISAIAAEPRIELGPPEVILHDQALGLRYFPDERLAIIRTHPDCRVLVAAGISSYLLSGPDMGHLTTAKKVLENGGRGAFDNGYAGIAAIERAPGGGLLAFYHAEDQEGMKPVGGGIPGFYCRIALAVSRDQGQTFEKRGPILASSYAKEPAGHPDQGLGEPCVLSEPGGKFLYAYYSSHERKAHPGVVIGLARCPISDSLNPGAWKKYYEGDFTEPGLGGKDTPVVTGGESADVLFPDVVFLPAQRQFAMFFCRNEWEAEKKSTGFYAAFSNDGIHWPAASIQMIWSVPTIARIGREVAWHPTFVLDSADAVKTTGWLYYGYSERWGHQPPLTPHYFIRRRLAIL